MKKLILLFHRIFGDQVKVGQKRIEFATSLFRKLIEDLQKTVEHSNNCIVLNEEKKSELEEEINKHKENIDQANKLVKNLNNILN